MGIFLNLQRTGGDWVQLRSENFRVLISFSYPQDYYCYYYYYYYYYIIIIIIIIITIIITIITIIITFL